ncbi:MAG: hypothetical protein KF744_01735 [Taibaiella sp.]|nr:hypothetical protein [Taibaiella sp.]
MALDWKKIYDVLAVMIIVSVAMAYRRFDSLTNPQLWAEDGAVFLVQNSEQGLKTLLMPYAGYLHTVPRLIAAIFGFTGTSLVNIPFAYNVSAYLFALGVSAYLYFCARQLGIRHTILYASFFSILPIGAEMFMNITNTIWISALLLLNFLLVGHKFYEVPMFRVPTLFLLVIAGLTGPFSLILSPLVLIIIYLERRTIFRSVSLLPLIVILLCGLLQVLEIANGDGVSRAIPGEPEKYHVLRMIAYNMNVLSLQSMLQYPGWLEKGRTAINLVLFMAVAFCVIKAYRSIAIDRRYVLAIAPVLFFGSFLFAFWPMETVATVVSAPRYYFVPLVCIASIFLIAANGRSLRLEMSIYLVYLFMFSPYLKSRFSDKDWKGNVEKYNQGTIGAIPINPDGWIISPKKKTK